MAPPLVWINGFPGSDKLTIAKALLECVGRDRVVIDNHQLVNRVGAIVSRSNPDYQRYCKAYRQKALDRTAAEPGLRRKAVVFTGITISFFMLHIAMSFQLIGLTFLFRLPAVFFSRCLSCGRLS